MTFLLNNGKKKVIYKVLLKKKFESSLNPISINSILKIVFFLSKKNIKYMEFIL